MAKYIDADRLCAEIEKHIKEVKAAAARFAPNMGFFDAKLSGVYDGVYDVMAIIDSLQQERPCEDLEKEFQEFCKDYPFPWSSAYINAEYIEELCKGVAKHFYELGKGSQPQLPANLDEAAEEYERSRGIVEVSDNEDCRRAFKAGAEWAIKQINNQ